MTTLFTPVQGEMLIALFAIGWGIVVESWFVSRHTIWFNIVPLIVMMTTLELNSEALRFLTGYVIISLIAVNVSGYDWLKQLLGAKGFGVLSLIFGMGASGLIVNSGS